MAKKSHFRRQNLGFTFLLCVNHCPNFGSTFTCPIFAIEEQNLHFHAAPDDVFGHNSQNVMSRKNVVQGYYIQLYTLEYSVRPIFEFRTFVPQLLLFQRK